MTLSRLVTALALVALAAAPALAGPRRGVGLPLDPEPLPPNSAPGDCVTRRVTGPGGAYRWERVECDPGRGWDGYDRWGYGRGRLTVETREDRHGPPPAHLAYRHGYAAAGRDEAGFLVWPGKRP